MWLEPIDRPGVRTAVRWPAGFRARFSPQLELLDPDGIVVARDGDVLTQICGYPEADGRFVIGAFNGIAYPPCS